MVNDLMAFFFLVKLMMMVVMGIDWNLLTNTPGLGLWNWCWIWAFSLVTCFSSFMIRRHVFDSIITPPCYDHV